MFATKDPHDNQGLYEAIDALIADIKTTETHTEVYKHKVDQLVKLYKLKPDTKASQVSADTLAVIAGNLLGILIIVEHERLHVIGSKALSFVLKLR